ncbi:hypothetical protein EJP67_00075 [Variovorax guangxiensis]|uniref:Uncharacterized protein n=1 Tax=Variovorax guangxiensis TaxID=1775474 RepID=A0A433MC62_9BURK|nr:hypothetical protein [Variovorax guangxiensis]RUR65448.1 hypothetical protein EJP67_00075 [Variovorax guangxiensis]
MGIEYRHFLVVDDANWRPSADTAARVAKLLAEWSIGTELVEAVDLSRRENVSFEEAGALAASGPGVALRYRGVKAAPVAALAGPSNYASVRPSDRYTTETVLILGNDYRIQHSSDSIFFDLVSPPLAVNGQQLAPDEAEPYRYIYSESFSSDYVLKPPVVRAQVEGFARKNIDWTECLGFWRGGLVIDFGKDLPGFVESVHRLPARAFVEALQDVFRGPVVEIGEFY